MNVTDPSAMLEEEASNTLAQRLQGPWSCADQHALEARLVEDPDFAEAFRLANDSLEVLDAHIDSPEMMRFRERALNHARLSTARRWFGPRARRPVLRWASAVAATIIACGVVWQLSPWDHQPDQYQTAIGEQRMLDLDDHSRVALDASTRITVRYTAETRMVELLEGQAQFSVASDPKRPFKVRVGDRTIVALGTIFTVDFTDRKLRVAMMEGQVMIMPEDTSLKKIPSPGASSQSVRSPVADARGIDGVVVLSAGQEARVSREGQILVAPRGDLEAANAWRNGKVVFRVERLADAIRRMNRYSRVQLEVLDSQLMDEPISGVFEAGDTQGFLNAVQVALPVAVAYPDADTVRISPRR